MQLEAPVVDAVVSHMNDDHADDNLLIARAFGFPEATVATMSGLDATSGEWQVTDPAGDHRLSVDWPEGQISERPQIRRAVVMLYREACRRLGVDPRDEHEAESSQRHGAHGHGAHGHGAGQHGAEAEGAEEQGLARRLREATWSDHGDSESATFMADVMRGKGTIDDYTALVDQHYVMYEALEEASRQLLEDDLLASLHPEALRRMDALERDLRHLRGEDWRSRIVAVPATEEYARRMREVAEQGWIAGILAHHYTRYLGDLSGGQMIARRVAAQFGFEDAGVCFYDFAELGDLAEFKSTYRHGLDAFGARLSDDEQVRMLDEVRAAYRHNTAVFLDLQQERVAV